MSPIKGLSEQKRIPRLGKIHLGIKKVSPRTNKEYPVATNYFVCPPEVEAVYGKEPRRLDVIIPLDDEETWANQYYRQYSRTRGLVCKGDGETCRRMLDTATGDLAGRETKTVTWREGCECLGRECPDYKGKACQEVMNLQFLLPKAPGLGVYQIDTGSIHSIRNINDCATMIRAMCGRVSWIPLVLTLEPGEVVNPEDGKKKIVHFMHLRYEQSAENLLKDAEKPRLQLLVATPRDDEAPDDRLPSTHTPEKAEEVIARAGDDIDELWEGKTIIEANPPATVKRGEYAKKGDAARIAAAALAESKKPLIERDWLRESMKRLAWTPADVAKHLKDNYKITANSVTEAVALMTPEQAKAFALEVNARLQKKETEEGVGESGSDQKKDRPPQ